MFDVFIWTKTKSSSSLVGWFGSWVANTHLHSRSSNLFAALHSRSHLWGHDGSLAGSLWSLVLILEGLFELDPFKVLLVFNFFLDVLVTLKQLIMLCFSQLESFVQVGLQFFLQSIHFILLLLNEFSLGSNDFLGSILHVFFTLLSFQIKANLLDFVCLLIPLYLNIMIKKGSKIWRLKTNLIR